MIHLDPAGAERQHRERARQLHVVTVPATRLIGFAALLLLVYLHNRFVLESFSWRAYLDLAGIVLGWSLLGWLLLYLLYARFATRLAFTLLFGDIAMFTLVIYATGGEKSLLFFILVVRSADLALSSTRQHLVFAHVSAAAYLALVAWLAVVEGRSLQWPAEALKIASLWAVCVYLASTGRIIETLRARTVAAVRAAWRRAEMRCDAKSQFLASMSHQIRSPLQAIIGSAHGAQESGVSTTLRRYLTTIEGAAQNLLFTANQVLDFFRAEAGAMDVERIAFRLRDALQLVVQSLGVHAEQRQLALSCRVEADVPDDLVGDVGRLRQVLTNLVENGLKFTERGAVTVSVRVAARRPDSVSLTFAVTDTGIGIRPEDRGVIFEAFAQASGHRGPGGAGLGLAIASTMVRQMGGDLQVESEPGRGSTFHFTIDFARGDPEQTTSPPEPDAAARRRLRVLVVEDDPMAAEVARDALEQRGHVVSLARTGRDMIEACERSEFDAVLMDVQLPDLDGCASAARLKDRRRSRAEPLRIVALSAGATSEERERCLTAGVDVYLTKPADPRALCAAVEGSPADGTAPPISGHIASLFAAEAPRLLGGVVDAVTRRDHEAVRRATHRLKGAVANFGPSPALDAAERMEAAAGGGDTPTADVDWTAVEGQVGVLTTAVTALIAQVAPARSASSGA